MHSDLNRVVDALAGNPCRRKQLDIQLPPHLIVDGELGTVVGLVLGVEKLPKWQLGDCTRFGRLLGVRVSGASVALPI